MTRSHFYGLVVFLLFLPFLPLQACEGEGAKSAMESLPHLAGSTDPVDKASLEGETVIDKDLEADNLSRSGLESGKVDDIDKAIAMFPYQSQYRFDKAALLLARGDIDGSNKALAEAKGITGPSSALISPTEYEWSLARVSETLPPGSAAAKRVFAAYCETVRQAQERHIPVSCPD